MPWLTMFFSVFGTKVVLVGALWSKQAICHSPFNGKGQSLTFDVWNYHAIQIKLFIFEGGGGGGHGRFLGGQRYIVRNSNNSKWNASYV